MVAERASQFNRFTPAPALCTAGRLGQAKNELARLRTEAAPQTPVDLDRVIPRLTEDYREFVADLPNVVPRDPGRAREFVRQFTGDVIRVKSDGETVRFLTKSGHLQEVLLRVAGGAASLQTRMVAEA
jgi:hypothetical protein